MKKLLLIILALSGILLFPRTAHAQTDTKLTSILSVSPVVIETSLNKGKNQTFEIQVKNLLPEPLGITASTEEFLAQDEENIPGTNENNSLVALSTVSPAQTIIDPQQTKTLVLTIKTPKSLKKGGYYEAIFLTPFFSKPINTSPPTILTKIGVLVLGTNGVINYKDLENKTSINEFFFDRLIYSNRQIDTVFKVSNSYFTHFNSKPFLTISPLLGKKQTYELTDKKILPGKIRTWNEPIRLGSSSFFNKATLAVSVGQGNFIYKDSFFLILPVKQILLLTSLVFVILIIKFRRKQIKKAFEILFKGK